MGTFKREKKTYRLKFDPEDYPDLEGFECYATGATLDNFLDIAEVQEALTAPGGVTRENVDKQLRLFGDHLQSWNLVDDDDQPVPCTYDSMKTLDSDFAAAIISAWQQAIAGVPKASSENSSSGETSAAESSLQLASLSQSLAS